MCRSSLKLRPPGAETFDVDGKWALSPTRLVCVVAVAFSLGAGAAVTVGAFSNGPSTRAHEEPAAPDFDSPRVTGLPIEEARRLLNDQGYDVIAVGSGEVALQELGYEGQLLQIEGERPGRRRYCTAADARCTTVRS